MSNFLSILKTLLRKRVRLALLLHVDVSGDSMSPATVQRT